MALTIRREIMETFVTADPIRLHAGHPALSNFCAQPGLGYNTLGNQCVTCGNISNQLIPSNIGNIGCVNPLSCNPLFGFSSYAPSLPTQQLSPLALGAGLQPGLQPIHSGNFLAPQSIHNILPQWVVTPFGVVPRV